MENKRVLKILAAIFALRARYYKIRQDYDAAVAYDNAFDMLAYAANESYDCLRQFGWCDEAESLIDKLGENIDFWELEDYIKEFRDED